MANKRPLRCSSRVTIVSRQTDVILQPDADKGAVWSRLPASSLAGEIVFDRFDLLNHVDLARLIYETTDGRSIHLETVSFRPRYE